MRFTRLTLVAAALTLFAGTAQAQTSCNGTTSSIGSCTASSNVAITVPYLASADATAISAFTLTVADLDAGFKLFAGSNVTVKANFNYKVTATAVAGTGTKATSNLLIGTASCATLTNCATMDAGREIGTGTASSEGNGKTFPTFHRLNIGWQTDAPGSQRYDLTYTVTAP